MKCKRCFHDKEYHDERGCHHSYGKTDNNLACLCLKFKSEIKGDKK